MKIWIKYLVGALIGAAFAFLAPPEDAGLRSLLGFLFDLSIRIGRYAFLPLLFFSVPVAVFELNEDGAFWSKLGKTLILLIGSVAALSLIGVLVTTLVSPARIPLVADAAAAMRVEGLRDFLFALFPDSALSVLGSGLFFLPLFFLATIIGLACSHDKSATKPVLLLFDSLSRIFYQINSFLTEFLGVFIIAVTARNILELRAAPSAEMYRPLLLTIGIEVLLVAGLLIPAALYFLGGRKNPYKTLYGLLAPSLAAISSGDLGFSMGSLFKHAKESLGLRRRSNAVSLPLAAVFGRAGTALVSSTAFIAILASYSGLGVSAGSVLWALIVVPGTTFILSSAPGRGPMACLVTLCALYGKGFENGFLIAAPIALPLAMAGTFIDVLWAGAAAQILAKNSGFAKEKEARFFI